MHATEAERIDGRLNAYRKLFLALLTHIGATDEGRAFLMALAEDNEIVSDHQEDPGVLPDSGFAEQKLAEDEIRSVIQSALSRIDALEAQAAKQKR